MHEFDFYANAYIDAVMVPTVALGTEAASRPPGQVPPGDPAGHELAWALAAS
jgi:hypothetical protein